MVISYSEKNFPSKEDISMRSHLRVLALLSLSVAFAMCAPASEEEPEAEATVEADLEAIGGLREVYAAAVNAGDVDRLTDSFTEDAVVMPPNEPVVTGYEAIESWFEANFEQFTTCVVLPQGDFARFLHEKPAQRQDLLTKLLGID
ncbi:MAG: nuclear transport factor 2 family protein, partial [Deltaproteobacteria bacterium]|nr:nuclear transport factor 2 family protein [Deltaproteobacteria bacterium]